MAVDEKKTQSVPNDPPAEETVETAEPLSLTNPIDAPAEEAAEQPAPDIDPDAPDSDPDHEPEPEFEESSASGEDAQETVAPADTTTHTVVERRGGFVAALTGGIVALVAAVVLLVSGVLTPVLQSALGGSDLTDRLSAVELETASQAAQIGTLGGQVAGLEIPDTSPLEGQIAGLDGKVTELGRDVSDAATQLGTAIGELDTRLTELEKRPVTEGVSQAAIDAYERELARLREAVTEQRGEVEALIAEARMLDETAAEAARAAVAQTALARLRAALDSGDPFRGALDDLAASGVALPDVLTGPADVGVATMAALRAGFPDPARRALADARAAASDDNAGLGAFLQRQLGARSVEAREGDDPDAILSRAEAALTNGDLNAAIAELSALPSAAQPAMAEWVQSASARAGAINAAETLATQ